MKLLDNDVFIIDKDIRKRMLKVQYKLHPNWEKNKRTVMVLWLIPILMGVFGYYLSLENPSGLSETLFLCVFPFFCIGLAPVITFYWKYRIENNDALYSTNNNSVEMLNHSFYYRYRDSRDSEELGIYEYLVLYKRIRQVKYNTVHNRLDIECPYYFKYYPIYGNGIYTVNRTENTMCMGPIRIYLTYKDKDLLINRFKEICGDKFIEVNEREF